MPGQKFVIRESATRLYLSADGNWSDSLEAAEVFATPEAAVRDCMARQIASFQIVLVTDPTRPVIELEKMKKQDVVKYGGDVYFFKTPPQSE